MEEGLRNKLKVAVLETFMAPAGRTGAAHDAPPWLQHGYALRGAVEMCRRAAAAGRLEAFGRPAQRRASGSGTHDDTRAVVVEALLQARHHGLTGDGAELVGEGAVEDQDVHGEDPLADGCGVLQDEALVDEEDAAWEEEDVKEDRTDAKCRTGLSSRTGPSSQPLRKKTTSVGCCWVLFRSGSSEGDAHLLLATGGKHNKDTEDEGDHGAQSQSHAEMGHPVVEGGHSHPVREDTLQAHEQQPGWERHAGAHVV